MSDWQTLGLGSADPMQDLLGLTLCITQNREHGPIEIRVMPHVWETICRSLNRPMTIERAEHHGTLVSHVAGHEVRIIASVEIEERTAQYRVVPRG